MSKELKLKLIENIEKYNNELFDLDNEIKKIRFKIKYYQKNIYNLSTNINRRANLCQKSGIFYLQFW